MMIGLIALSYGMYYTSFTLIIEGSYLVWLGFNTTKHIMEHYRLEEEVN